MDKNLDIALKLNNCLLGVSICEHTKAVYSILKCIEIIIKEESISLQEAEDFFYYNVVGSNLGEKSPIFVALKQELSKDKDFYNLSEDEVDEIYNRYNR